MRGQRGGSRGRRHSSAPAFTKVVNSLVEDIIMPPSACCSATSISPNLFMVLKEGAKARSAICDGGRGKGSRGGDPQLRDVLSTIVTFLIVASWFYMMVRSAGETRSEKGRARRDHKGMPVLPLEDPAQGKQVRILRLGAYASGLNRTVFSEEEARLVTAKCIHPPS